MPKYSDPEKAFKVARRYITNNALRRKQKSINLSDFGLDRIPSELSKLENIEIIDLSNNKIKSVDTDLNELINLKGINLSRNEIEAIPSALLSKSNIMVLDLSNNRLSEFPLALCGLKNLRYLKLDNNLINEIPPDIASMISLEDLSMAGNAIKTLPKELSKLSKLESIDFHSNKISNIPEYICALPNLKRMQLSHNAIIETPDYISVASGLEGLAIASNRINEICPEIFSLPKLRGLWVSGNPLYSIPDEISNARKLQTLSAANCRLSKLNPAIFELSELIELILSTNNLSEVDKNISKLSKLQILDLSQNNISTLPDSLGQMNNLVTEDRKYKFRQGIRILDNPLQEPLNRIVKLDDPPQTATMLGWLRGDISADDLNKILADVGTADLSEASDDANSINEGRVPKKPDLAAGPVFQVSDGQIDLTPSYSNSNEYEERTQQILLNRLRKQVGKLRHENKVVSNQYPDLTETVAEYDEILSNDINDIDVVSLWAVGSALMAQAASFDGQNILRTNSNPLEPQHKALLLNIAGLHGGFILGFPLGAELTQKSDRARVAPEVANTIRNPTEKVLSAISGKTTDTIPNSDFLRDVVSGRTRRLAASLGSSLVAAGWTSARIGESSYVTVRNFLIEAGRIAILVNDKGGGAIGTVALAALGMDSQSINAILNFMYHNSSQILSFAAPFPELRTWIDYIINQIEMERR